MTGADCLPSVEDVAWVRVEDPSAPGRARRIAAALAEKQAFTATRVAEIEIAFTELGTNLHKHAQAGVLVVRSVRVASGAAIDVLAIDRGPGIADVEAASQDGQSSTGTLGVGLGAVSRLADSYELFSEVGRGTVVAARFGSRRPPLPDFDDSDVAGLTRPITGEEVCGDSYASLRRDGVTRLMMCDGSGHGPLAASASRAAVRVFCADGTGSPEDVVERIHRSLRGTRGGAVAVVDVDPSTRTVRFAGVGNIAGSVVHGGRKQSMVSVPGIAGYQARTIRAFDYPLDPGAAVVLHSDGLTEKWTAQGRERLFVGGPRVIAAALMRDAGVHKDDAGVLVCKPPGP